MGKVKEALHPVYEIEERIKLERAEAEYFAVPDALHENLEISRGLVDSHKTLREENADLKQKLTEIGAALSSATSWKSKWKERGIGIILGCAASILASGVWWQMGKQWPLLR